MSQQFSKTRILVECAILAAVAFVLSYLPSFSLPFGGSWSWFATVPILIASMRHGWKWGVPTALVFSFTQLLLGIGNFSYLPNSVFPVLGSALLDYIIAYTIIGFAGLIFRKFKNRILGIVFAVILTGIGRLASSVLSGILIWGRPDDVTWTQNLPLYSLGYNALWCGPDVALALVGVLVLASIPALKLLPKKNA